MKRALRLAACGILMLAPTPSRAGASADYPFRDPALPTERRIDDLVSRLTLDEKISFLGTRFDLPRLGIRAGRIVEGLHGLAMSGPANWAHKPTIPTTTFPQGIGLGMTWDPELVREIAAAEAFEARYIFQSPKYGAGGLVVLSPNADLGRDPRWGRTEECYGEDPFLTGTMAVAFVRGLQGDHPKYWTTASLLKHFLANSNEHEREFSSSNFDERLFREYYSAPFRRGIVEGGSRAFMAAYNKVNGVPMHVHPMLRDVAMRQWGQDGIICTDGGGLGLLVTAHKAFPDLETAAAACIKAGITMFLDDYRAAVRGALDRKLLEEADVDAAIRRTFRVLMRLGLLDPPGLSPYATIGTGPEPWLSEKHKALARLATRKSIVLLQNAGGALPLDRRALKSIAVIGPRAAEVISDWYAGTPPYAVTPLEGIRSKAGAGVTVRHARDNANGAAVEAARASDVAVVVVGNHPTCEDMPWAQCPRPSDGREGVDRQSLALEQEALVREVFAANPRTIVVLVSSFPYAIEWTSKHVPAIVHMTHSSQETGTALAEVLFGDYNPAGRLVQTWPRSLEQLPPMMDYDIRNGRTYMYFKGEPLYPFGHGLSYTTFAYSRLRASVAGNSVRVSFDLKNTGGRAGEEVAQVYARYLDSAVARPKLELKGFERVALRPGEMRTVTVTVPVADFGYWDAARGRFVVEAGRVEVLAGGSSAELKLAATVRMKPQSSP